MKKLTKKFMALIVPSILEDTPDAFREKLEAILTIPDVERIQVDVSDGRFTPRTTIAVRDIDILNPAYTWELHLMCGNPSQYFLDAKIAGFSAVLFPFEAVAQVAACRARGKAARAQAGTWAVGQSRNFSARNCSARTQF